ncbi:MAG: 1-acyl-sn-glycerol-3-phosphate acyltransferase [Gemmatimonadetes bacterium]|nr:1-acyl-sn-glycerol-3-phosphate acyltransferase [Gemmatimonadota bacterium]
MLRTALGLATFVIGTTIHGLHCFIARLLGIPDTPGGPYDRASRRWCQWLCWAAGAKVEIHGAEHLQASDPRVYVANHVSWYDIFALAQVLPHQKFVAKAELRSLPLFGWGATAWGVVWIERENRKNAFAAYETAAKRIREGVSVVVFPEGTRGDEYPLRQFKKGPFVLAIASGVPIVPTLVYGAREVNPRGTLRLTPGTVHLHFLPAIPTAGLTYDDRDDLARRTRDAIAACLQQEYGIASLPSDRVKATRGISPSAPVALPGSDDLLSTSS